MKFVLVRDITGIMQVIMKKGAVPDSLLESVKVNKEDVVSFGGIVKDRSGNERASFTARTAFDRRDYGLFWDPMLETGGIVVGEKVGVGIKVEAVRHVAAASAAA